MIRITKDCPFQFDESQLLIMRPCKIILGIKIFLSIPFLVDGQSSLKGTVPGPFSTHGRAKETVIGKRIQRVVDGDTVIVDGRRIRLLNVDTEESVHPNQSRNTSFGRKPAELLRKQSRVRPQILNAMERTGTQEDYATCLLMVKTST